MGLQDVIDEVVAGTPGVSWSIAIPGLAEHAPGRRMRTASVGKLLLLIETARQIETGELDPSERLGKDPALAVADSGLWQHLAVEALAVEDLAVLIAAVSDNYATNVLLARVGLDAVATTATALGLRETALHDRVRDRREPHHPPTLSTGAAGELAELMQRIARRDLSAAESDAKLTTPEEPEREWLSAMPTGLSEALADRVDGWMATSVDLSMVASGFGADPLAHGRGVRNKTGTDDGIRADVGYFGDRAYAVLAEFAPADTAAVLQAMGRIGTALATRQ